MANVVLVHGAFAEGSSWSKVIPLLLAKGHRVTSVAIPLTSFAEDVAATKRAIGAQEGPVVLVGHSYGGVVVTEAGNDAKVTGLVYVAAFAPDAGQSIGDVSKGFPEPPGAAELRPPSAAAWRTKESFYVVASKDRMIAPEQEQSMAKTIGAKTISVPSSHCAMLSHPAEAAQVIDEAAYALASR